jgi:hypothetical protein
LANTKPLRSRPKKKRDRKQLAELNNLLADPSIAGELRARLEAERDILAPIIGSLSEAGSPTQPANPAPAVTHHLKAGVRSAAELDQTRARLSPLLSTRTVTPETTAFAIEAVTFTLNLFHKKFSDLSPVQQLGMIRFQFDAWAKTQPSAETLAVVDEVHGTRHLK